MKKLNETDDSKRIAVIEEKADNIYSMRFILQSLGYKVSSFSSKRNFIEKLVEFDPSVILIDMLMPAGGGIRVMTEIKKSSLREIRIIAVTADAVPFSEEELKKSGADAVLTKPYTVADMQEKLEP